MRISVRHNAWKLLLVRALFWTHFISSVLIPFYRDWGGLSFAWILGLNAWFMVWNFLLEIPTGTVADVWGRKASLVLGSAVGAGAAIFYTTAPDLGRFLVAEVLFAASFTLMSGADEALLWDSLVETDRVDEGTKWIGRLASSQLVGIVVGALLGSPIAAWLGLTAPLRLQSIPMALAGLLALTLVETEIGRPTTRPRFADVVGAGFRKLRRSAAVRHLALDMIFHAAIAWMIIWFYQPLLEGVGIGLVWFGLVHTGMSLGQIAVLSNLGRLETWAARFRTAGLDESSRRRMGARRLLLLGPIVAGLGFLVLATRSEVSVVLVAIVLVAAFALSRPPLVSSYLNLHFDSAERATALSTVAMLRTLTTALLYPLVGLLADRSLTLAVGLLAALSLVGVALSPIRVDDLHPESSVEP